MIFGPLYRDALLALASWITEVRDATGKPGFQNRDAERARSLSAGTRLEAWTDQPDGCVPETGAGAARPASAARSARPRAAQHARDCAAGQPRGAPGAHPGPAPPGPGRRASRRSRASLLRLLQRPPCARQGFRSVPASLQPGSAARWVNPEYEPKPATA